MKKILLIIIVLLTFFAFRESTYAQVKTGKLAITVYEDREDLDVLFENSLRVLEYLEGVDVEEPLFISLVDDLQIKNIQDNNLKPEVIDENADIDSYILLYHPQENQGERLAGFGNPIQISKHYTLLKLFPGQQFSHEGEGGTFFDIPFQEVIVTPPLRTKTATEAIDSGYQDDQRINPFIAIVILFVLIAIGAGAFIYIRKRKNKAR